MKILQIKFAYNTPIYISCRALHELDNDHALWITSSTQSLFQISQVFIGKSS